jgi:hypothetical protein
LKRAYPCDRLTKIIPVGFAQSMTQRCTLRVNHADSASLILVTAGIGDAQIHKGTA